MKRFSLICAAFIVTATTVLGTRTLTYQGDSGRILSSIPTAGPKVLMDYGNAAEDFRLKEISNQTSAGAIISQHNYTFTKDSQIATWRRSYGLGTPPPAETFSFDYDAADRLLGASLKNTSTGAVLADHRFIYDPIDNRVSIREGGKLRSGTFNSANQLTAETGGGKVRITGSVNKAGASVTVAGKAAAVHPNGGFAVEVDAAEGANHLPLVVTEADGTVTTKYVDLVFDQAEPLLYTYDANGNLETVAPAATPILPRQTYEWDAADRLIAMVRHVSTSDTRRTEFLYNGKGSRVGKKEFVNGVLQSDIRYIYGGTGVLQERSADGGSVLKTFTASGELDYTTTPSTPRFYTRDHLGSVREVVAEDGSLLARYDYKPYGERILMEGTYEATKGYTGHDYLPEAGMILTRYRAYDPLTGRWLSPDPIAEEGGLNLYGYVYNDPVNLSDPLGLFGVVGIAEALAEQYMGPIANRAGAAAYLWGNGAMDLYDSVKKDCFSHDGLATNLASGASGGKKFKKGAELLGAVGKGLKKAPKTTGEIVEHGSQRAARRAADRDAGMGRHGGREQLPDKPLHPGSQAPEGQRGVRTETRSTDTGKTAHHDPYGTRYKDGRVTPPHYGVETPGQPTRHHTYPSDHDPQTNR